MSTARQFITEAKALGLSESQIQMAYDKRIEEVGEFDPETPQFSITAAYQALREDIANRTDRRTKQWITGVLSEEELAQEQNTEFYSKFYNQPMTNLDTEVVAETYYNNTSQRQMLETNRRVYNYEPWLTIKPDRSASAFEYFKAIPAGLFHTGYNSFAGFMAGLREIGAKASLEEKDYTGGMLGFTTGFNKSQTEREQNAKEYREINELKFRTVMQKGDDARNWWLDIGGKTPDYVQDAFGFQLAEGFGQLPFIALGLIPYVGPALLGSQIVGQYYAEGLEESEGDHDIATAYTSIFAPLGFIVDRFILGAGKGFTKAALPKSFKQFATKEYKKLGIEIGAGAGGEFLTETAESMYLQKRTTGEINVSQALREGLLAFIIGGTGATIFGGTRAAQGSKRVKKLLNLKDENGDTIFTEEEAVEIIDNINEGDLETASNIGVKVFLNKILKKVGMQVNSETVGNTLEIPSQYMSYNLLQLKSLSEMDQARINNVLEKVPAFYRKQLEEAIANPSEKSLNALNKQISEFNKELRDNDYTVTDKDVQSDLDIEPSSPALIESVEYYEALSINELAELASDILATDQTFSENFKQAIENKLEPLGITAFRDWKKSVNILTDQKKAKIKQDNEKSRLEIPEVPRTFSTQEEVDAFDAAFDRFQEIFVGLEVTFRNWSEDIWNEKTNIYLERFEKKYGRPYDHGFDAAKEFVKRQHIQQEILKIRAKLSASIQSGDIPGVEKLMLDMGIKRGKKLFKNVIAATFAYQKAIEVSIAFSKPVAEPTPVVEETQQETAQEFFERTKPAKTYKDFGEKKFVIGQEGKPLILKLSDLDETIPMNELRYDVTELAEFIEENGLPDDVRLLIEVTDKGVIIREGNHRIAALRMLKEQGKINDYDIPFELQYNFPLQESTDVWMPKSLQSTPVVEPTVTEEVKVYPPKPGEDIVVIDESLEALSDDELDILEKDLNKRLNELEDKLVPSMTDEGLFQNFTQEEINELINVRRQIDSLEVETFRRQREIIEEGDEAFYTLEDMATDFINIAKDNRFVAESANEGLAKLAILIDIANKNNSLKKVANIIDSRKQKLRDADEIELFDIALNNLNLKVNEIKNLQKEASAKQTPLAIAEPAPVVEQTSQQSRLDELTDTWESLYSQFVEELDLNSYDFSQIEMLQLMQYVAYKQGYDPEIPPVELSQLEEDSQRLLKSWEPKAIEIANKIDELREALGIEFSRVAGFYFPLRHADKAHGEYDNVSEYIASAIGLSSSRRGQYYDEDGNPSVLQNPIQQLEMYLRDASILITVGEAIVNQTNIIKDNIVAISAALSKSNEGLELNENDENMLRLVEKLAELQNIAIDEKLDIPLSAYANEMIFSLVSQHESYGAGNDLPSLSALAQTLAEDNKLAEWLVKHGQEWANFVDPHFVVQKMDGIGEREGTFFGGETVKKTKEGNAYGANAELYAIYLSSIRQYKEMVSAYNQKVLNAVGKYANNKTDLNKLSKRLSTLMFGKKASTVFLAKSPQEISDALGINEEIAGIAYELAQITKELGGDIRTGRTLTTDMGKLTAKDMRRFMDLEERVVRGVASEQEIYEYLAYSPSQNKNKTKLTESEKETKNQIIRNGVRALFERQAIDSGDYFAYVDTLINMAGKGRHVVPLTQRIDAWADYLDTKGQSGNAAWWRTRVSSNLRSEMFSFEDSILTFVANAIKKTNQTALGTKLTGNVFDVLRVADTDKIKQGIIGAMGQLQRARINAFLVGNVGWTLTTQPSSLALTIKQTGFSQTFKAIAKLINRSDRKSLLSESDVAAIKSKDKSVGGLESVEEFRELKMRKGLREKIRATLGVISQTMESALSNVSYIAGYNYAKENLGLNERDAIIHGDFVAATTQSMYDRMTRNTALNSTIMRFFRPMQSYVFTAMSNALDSFGVVGVKRSVQTRLREGARFILAQRLWAIMWSYIFGDRDEKLFLDPTFDKGTFGSNVPLFGKDIDIMFSELLPWQDPKTWMGDSPPEQFAKSTTRILKAISDPETYPNWERETINYMFRYVTPVFGIGANIQLNNLTDMITAVQNDYEIQDIKGRKYSEYVNPNAGRFLAGVLFGTKSIDLTSKDVKDQADLEKQISSYKKREKAYKKLGVR